MVDAPAGPPSPAGRAAAAGTPGPAVASEAPARAPARRTPAAPPVPLCRLLEGVRGRAFGRWEGVAVHGIAVDSRRVLPGDLFVALRGAHAEGAAFVGQALERGAVALVLPEGAAPPDGSAGLWVAEPRVALSRAAAAFYGHPSRVLRVLGVTGSNGKTTVTAMAAHILRAAGLEPGFWSTNEVWSGTRRFRPALTTPEAHDLQRFLAEVRDAGMRHACLEVSSHAVAQHRIDDVHFAAGAVTGLSADHLDFHGTLAAYVEAKRGFVRALPGEALCFYNLDDEGARRVAEAARCRRLSFGTLPEADLRLEEQGGGPLRARARLRLSPRVRDAWHEAAGNGALGVSGPAAVDLELAVPGRHNLANAAAAMGLALAVGVPPAAAARALADFSLPSRRLAVYRAGPYTLIDDVAMNEASYDAVLATVAAGGFGGVVVVVAPRGHRGTDANARIGAALARWNRRLGFAPLVVSLSRDFLERYDQDYSVRPAELEALVAAARDGGLGARVHAHLETAVGEAIARLRPGGALVLLGTFGMDAGAALALRLLGAPGEPAEFPSPTLG